MHDVPICASWSELGRVHIWDLKRMMAIVSDDMSMESDENNEDGPLFTFEGHNAEGFALDWCPTVPGMFYLLLVLWYFYRR